LGCSPAERIAADKAAMLALPPVSPPIGWEHTLRLPRDHYVRLDSNDYSVHPSAVGRRVLIRADLDRVRAWCEDGLVADHDRIWARHQTISDPGYVKAARMLRQQRFATDHRNRGGAAPSGRLRQRTPGCRIRRRNDMMTGTKTARDVSAEIAYLTRALKAPTLRESAGRLAERARSESWTHEEYLAACLQREVAARDAHGGEDRIRAAQVPFAPE
jgi:hypothetical protein